MIVLQAHRLVLIAACPMLQHMENASLGSHLEVRLASDIKQESVNMFLQYLYEGFMKLTEKNYKEIQKIGKLLQVDGITKCCADFAKCLQTKTDTQRHGSSDFDIQEQPEFKFVRATDLEQSFHPGDRGQTMEYSHGSNKRARIDDRYCFGQDYHDSGDTNQGKQSSEPQTIEILDDGLEVINMEPAEKDKDGWPVESNLPPIEHRMGVGVSSQSGYERDLRVISISDQNAQISPPVQPHSAITKHQVMPHSALSVPNHQHSMPDPSQSMSRQSSPCQQLSQSLTKHQSLNQLQSMSNQLQSMSNQLQSMSNQLQSMSNQLQSMPNLSLPHPMPPTVPESLPVFSNVPVTVNQNKPFAAGNAAQAKAMGTNAFTGR